MQKRIRIKTKILPIISEIVEEKSLSQIVGSGALTAIETLFDHCNIVKTRLGKLNRVVEALEDSLTSDSALEELRTKPMAVRFDYYNAFTKIMLNLTGYMEKVHLIVADQAKFNLIKDKIEKLLNPDIEKDNQLKIVESKDTLDNLLDILKDEMDKRSRND